MKFNKKILALISSGIVATVSIFFPIIFILRKHKKEKILSKANEKV